jgi:hypothetical protein
MGSLIKLATWALIESGRAGSARAATVRMTAAALCAGLAAVLVLAALGCTATALWVLVLPTLGPVGAPLVVAACLSVMTLILAMAGWMILRRKRLGPDIAVAPEFLLSEATRLFSEHKGAVLLAALVAGVAVANGSRKP